MFVVVYQDAYKPRRAEILGVYDSKEKAIELLLNFLTEGNSEEYEEFKNELLETGTAAEEYSIHEVELNKEF